MKVTILGTAAALPDPDRGHSSILVTISEDQHYLFDCGHGATRQMLRAHVDPADVNVIFFTHLHFDHIADFPFFALSSWICNREKKPIVLGPPKTDKFINSLFEGGAFDTDIVARAQFPARANSMEMIRPEVRMVETGLIYEDEYVRVYAEYVDHIPQEICECFAFRLESKVDGKSVVFSGDTSPQDSVIKLAQDCELLIHECTFPQEALDYREKIGIGTASHTSPSELGKIAKEANVKCLIATHFATFDTSNPVVKNFVGKHMPIDMVGPDLINGMVQDIREKYDGPLRMAHDLMRIDV